VFDDAQPGRVLALDGFLVAVAAEAGTAGIAEEFVDARLDTVDAPAECVVNSLDISRVARPLGSSFRRATTVAGIFPSCRDQLIAILDKKRPVQ
jgi:hypothetical protein